MADNRDTERLASGLLNVLRDALSKPLPGTTQTQPRPQVDEDSLLDTIKDFLTQSLPGTKEQEEQHKPAASSGGSAKPKPPVASEVREEEPADEIAPEIVSSTGNSEGFINWEAMTSRQEQEREAMHRRHEQEREEMHRRHEQEREIMAHHRERDKEDEKHKREMEREDRKRGREQAKENRGRGKGKG